MPPPNPDAVVKPGKAPRRTNYSKRGSSGNWAADRMTWQEELRYKRVMGFLGPSSGAGSSSSAATGAQ